MIALENSRSAEGSCAVLPKNIGSGERSLSVAAGSALALVGGRKTGLTRYALLGLAGSLIFRGVTGHCAINRLLGRHSAKRMHDLKGIRVKKSIVINREIDELYQFWRRLRNLPRVMSHIEAVDEVTDKRSHWVVKAPLGNKVEWDAEIVEESPGKFIRWQSLPEADVENEGVIRFEGIPGGAGTKLTVSLRYDPPGGSLGVVVSRLFAENPENQIEDDLRRFKRMIESGDSVSTTAEQAQVSH